VHRLLPFALALTLACNPIDLQPNATAVDSGFEERDLGIDNPDTAAEALLVITTPVDGDAAPNSLIDVFGTAYVPDGIGAVFVSVGPNTPIRAESETGFRDWHATLPVTPGTTTVQAELFDLNGDRVAAAGPITIVADELEDSVPPQVQITAPEPGASFPRALVLVRGTTSDDRGVVAMEVYRDGELLQERSVETGDWYQTWSRLVPLIPGRTSQITVQAFDQGGRTSEATISLTSRATQDRDAPELEVSYPSESEVINGSSLTMIGTAFDTSSVREVKVRWAVDASGVPAWTAFGVAETEDGFGSWTYRLSPPPGPVVAEIRAIDAGGLSTTVTRLFTADYIAAFGPEQSYVLRDRAADAAEVIRFSLDREGVSELISPEIQQDLVLLEIDSLPLLTNTLAAVKDACGIEWREDRSDPRHNCSSTELGQTFAGPDGEWQSSAEYAMVRILTMTPANAQVAGTSIAGLQELADGRFFGITIGGGFSQILSDALGIPRTQEFLATETTAQALLEGVVATHPNTGPDGQLAITLWDAMNDLAPMAERLGPVGDHPGIVDPAEPPSAVVLGPDFRMILGAQSNLRWYDGVDLSEGKDYLSRIVDENGPTFDDIVEFDFEDPDLFDLIGLVDEPRADLRFQVSEADTFVPSCAGSAGCQGNLPGAPFRENSVWALDPWFMEWAIATGAMAEYGEREFSRCYLNFLGCQATVEIGAGSAPPGWARFDVTLDLGDPPEDQYVWELVNEIGQVALHEPSGGTIPEGRANVAFSVRDIPVGLTAEQIRQAVRPVLQEQRRELADRLFEGSGQNNGPVDFYFGRMPNGDAALFFANAADERPGEFTYDTLGFYSSDEFRAADRVSEVDSLGRDFVVVGTTESVLWVQDDRGVAYRLRARLDEDEIVLHAAESFE
jgi:hypothetical protein